MHLHLVQCNVSWEQFFYNDFDESETTYTQISRMYFSCQSQRKSVVGYFVFEKMDGGEDFATRINRVTYISSEVVLHPNSGFVIAIQDDYATNAE